MLNMHNHYIINEAVEFHPATSTLRDIHNPDIVVALNSPAGRCLLLLINRLGEVVTQHELMNVVWKQSGLTVTSNAYYQSISVLRKGLKRIGLGEDIIVTLPRIGLTLASGTRIKKLTTEKATEINHDNIHFIDVPDLTHEEQGSHFNEMLANGVPKSAFSGRGFQLQHLFGSWKAQGQTISRYVLIFLVIVPCTFLIFVNISKYKQDFFSDYISVMTVKKCEILLPSTITTNDEKENAIRYGEHFTKDCQTNPGWIYVTTKSNLPRVSVIRCNKPFNESTNCISTYFIE